MDQGRLAQQPLAVCARDLSMVPKHWVFIHYDADCAYSAFLNPVPTVYYTMRHLRVGRLVQAEFRHASQLSAIGNNR